MREANIREVVSRFAISTDRPGSVSASSPLISVAARGAVPMSRRRSPSESASSAANSFASRPNDRHARADSAWVRSTVAPSSIRSVVWGRCSAAVRVNPVAVSSSSWRSSPVPCNAVYSSSTTTRIASVGTDSVSSLRFASRVWTGRGVVVDSRGITEPSSRYGPASVRGCRSTYCSPTADRFATTAREFTGMGGASSSSTRSASIPSSVSRSAPTRPTDTPR